MHLLALDTCDPSGSVALLRDEVATRIESHSTDEDYSTWLLPAVKRVLAAENVGMAEIDLYAVAAGPGSFTGVRSGLTTVKAWAEVYGRPIAAVSRLQALAEESSGRATYVAAFFDARRNQIFGGLYKRSPQLIPVDDEAVLPAQEFVDWCTSKAGNDSIDWVSPQPNCLSQVPLWSARQAKGEGVEQFTGSLSPRIGLIGARHARAGKLTDALRLDANYIRRCDAEVAWKGAARGGKTLAVKPWTIRPFQPKDLGHLSALAEISAASPQASQFSAEDYQGIACMPGGILLLCESGVQICGLIAGRQTLDEAEILNLAIHPTVRRLGMASALLKTALTEFASNGIACVFLEVRESNTPAVALYERFGFSISRRRKGYYRDPVEDGLCLMRKLTVRES